ncbi:MAG: efflux RND transporter periplasmic adaptor subunit [bacterium]|nr:efflux RND transporter periplasmic adaptor subunit [bacterium]
MKKTLLLKIGILLIILSLLTFSCGDKKTEKKEIIRPVRTQTVYAAGAERMRTFSGTIKSGQEARLSFKVSGTIRSIHIKVGDKVKAGKLLAEMDRKDYQLQVQQAEAGLDQGRAQALNAASAYERVRGLYENRNASKSSLDSARAGYESATASVRSMEKRLELAKLQLSYTRLYAPVDGSIAGLNTEVNENVGAGAPVILLTGGKKLEVNVSIPEILISSVKEGEKVTIKVDALKDKPLTGIIKEVGVSTTNVGAAFPVTVQIAEKEAQLRSGMSAEVTFNFKSDSKKKVILLPPFAVGEDRDGRYVFTVKKQGEGQGIIERKKVETGDITAGGLEILGGLTDGDIVVTAGLSRIKKGQKVKLQPEK